MIRRTFSAVVALTLCLASFGASAEKTKVVISGGTYLDVPQLSVAMDKDLWAEENLEAEVIPFKTGRAAFEAMIGGQLDFAFMAEFPAVIGAMLDKDFRVIAEMSQYTATRIIHNQDASIDSVAKLDGLKIGVTTGTNVHYMLENELAMAGVKAELVSVSPPDIVPALARGDVDAGAMFPSFYGGAKKTLGDKYQEIGVPSYGTHFILAATKKMIDEKPEVVAGVLNALYKAEGIVVSDPASAHTSVSNVLGGTLKPDDVAAAFENSSHYMQLNNELINLIVEEGAWISAQGKIKADPPTADHIRNYVDGSFLKAIDESRVKLN